MNLTAGLQESKHEKYTNIIEKMWKHIMSKSRVSREPCTLQTDKQYVTSRIMQFLCNTSALLFVKIMIIHYFEKISFLINTFYSNTLIWKRVKLSLGNDKTYLCKWVCVWVRFSDGTCYPGL